MNLATQSSASSADEIRESGRAFQSLIVWGEEATFINICIGNGSLKCHRVLISTTPSFGDKVICWYTGFTFKNSGEVLTKLKSRNFREASLFTYEFSQFVLHYLIIKE